MTKLTDERLAEYFDGIIQETKVHLVGDRISFDVIRGLATELRPLVTDLQRENAELQAKLNEAEASTILRDQIDEQIHSINELDIQRSKLQAKIAPGPCPQKHPAMFWKWPMCWHWDSNYKTPNEALAAGAYAEQKPQGLVSAHANFCELCLALSRAADAGRASGIDAAISRVDQIYSRNVSHENWHSRIHNGLVALKEQDPSASQAVEEIERKALQQACEAICPLCAGTDGFAREASVVADYAQQNTYWHALTTGRRGHDECKASAIRALASMGNT